MINIENKEFLTKNEIADTLKVSLITISRYMKNGTLKYIKIGKRVYFPKEQLKELINYNR